MKASLKFRDEQQPLVKAKIPVSILGLPFLSAISAGETEELRLDLGTAFESGPSFRVCYRPNDARKPFSFIIKTGAGSLGSPNCASMAMSAEFGLLGRGSPSFTLQIKPQIGDFSLRKSFTSIAGSFPPFSPAESSHDLINGAGFCSKKPNGISTSIASTSSSAISDLLSGVELTSQSLLPLRNKAELKFRWGVRVPSEIKPNFIDYAERESPFHGISRCKLPFLVMSKISIEQVREKSIRKPDNDLLSLQKQVAVLRDETGMIRTALEVLRAEVRSSERSIPSVAARSPPPSKNGKAYEAAPPPPPEPARR